MEEVPSQKKIKELISKWTTGSKSNKWKSLMTSSKTDRHPFGHTTVALNNQFLSQSPALDSCMLSQCRLIQFPNFRWEITGSLEYMCLHKYPNRGKKKNVLRWKQYCEHSYQLPKADATLDVKTTKIHLDQVNAGTH